MLYTGTKTRSQQNMLGGKSNQNFNIFLANVDNILTTDHAKTEPNNGTSQLQPPVTGSHRVVNGSVQPTCRLEGVGFEVGLLSKWRGQLRDEGWRLVMVPLPIFTASQLMVGYMMQYWQYCFWQLNLVPLRGTASSNSDPPIVLPECRSRAIGSHIDQLLINWLAMPTDAPAWNKIEVLSDSLRVTILVVTYLWSPYRWTCCRSSNKVGSRRWWRR